MPGSGSELGIRLVGGASRASATPTEAARNHLEAAPHWSQNRSAGANRLPH